MKTRIVQNLKDRSKIALRSKWLHLPFHDASGSTLDQRNTDYSSLDGLTISGTTSFRGVTTNTSNITGVIALDAPTTAAAGNGTLTFTATGTLLAWAENGDTAGAGVDVSAGGMFTLASNNGQPLNVGVVAANLPAANQTDTITLGDTSGIWTNRGTITPHSGGNYVLINNSDTDDLMPADIDGTGHYLVMYRAKILQNPYNGASVEECILSIGGRNNSTGSLQCIFTYGANANILTRFTPVGGSSGGAQVQFTSLIGSEITVAHHWDFVSRTETSYINGGSPISTAMNAGSPPGTGGHGLGILAKADASTVYQELGVLGSGISVGDIFLAKFNYDAAADIPGYVQQHSLNPYSWPWSIDGK